MNLLRKRQAIDEIITATTISTTSSSQIFSQEDEDEELRVTFKTSSQDRPDQDFRGHTAHNDTQGDENNEEYDERYQGKDLNEDQEDEEEGNLKRTHLDGIYIQSYQYPPQEDEKQVG